MPQSLKQKRKEESQAKIIADMKELDEVMLQKVIQGNFTGKDNLSYEVRLPKEARQLVDVDKNSTWNVIVRPKRREITLRMVSEESNSEEEK